MKTQLPEIFDENELEVLNRVQANCFRTSIYSDPRDSFLNLAGEIGEFCGKISKAYRDYSGLRFDDNGIVALGNMTVDSIKHELGDIFWQMCDALTWLEFDLADIVRMNQIKLRSRAERKQIGGAGDVR